MAKYGVPEFEKLKTSTRTIVVYCNMEFVLEKIFRSIPVTTVEVPLTKKKKNVDKRLIKAPYGSVIGLSYGCKNMLRGIDLRKAKKHWCPACRPTKLRGDREIRDNTVVEELHKMPGTDVLEIKYCCTKCKQYFSLKQLKKITNFLNQVTISLFFGGYPSQHHAVQE